MAVFKIITPLCSLLVCLVAILDVLYPGRLFIFLNYILYQCLAAVVISLFTLVAFYVVLRHLHCCYHRPDPGHSVLGTSVRTLPGNLNFCFLQKQFSADTGHILAFLGLFYA